MRLLLADIQRLSEMVGSISGAVKKQGVKVKIFTDIKLRQGRRKATCFAENTKSMEEDGIQEVMGWTQWNVRTIHELQGIGTPLCLRKKKWSSSLGSRATLISDSNGDCVRRRDVLGGIQGASQFS